MQFLLLILREYISKRNQENCTSAGLWTLKCTKPSKLYVRIALVQSYFLTFFFPSRYFQILSPQSVKSSNSRFWQGWNLTDRLLCHLKVHSAIEGSINSDWPVAHSNVTVHHPTDKLNSFEWRQCLKTAELLIWRLNYYNALWKSMFLHDFQIEQLYLFSTWSSYLFLNGLPHFMQSQMFIVIPDISYHTICIHS